MTTGVSDFLHQVLARSDQRSTSQHNTPQRINSPLNSGTNNTDQTRHCTNSNADSATSAAGSPDAPSLPIKGRGQSMCEAPPQLPSQQQSQQHSTDQAASYPHRGPAKRLHLDVHDQFTIPAPALKPMQSNGHNNHYSLHTASTTTSSSRSNSRTASNATSPKSQQALHDAWTMQVDERPISASSSTSSSSSSSSSTRSLPNSSPPSTRNLNMQQQTQREQQQQQHQQSEATSSTSSSSSSSPHALPRSLSESRITPAYVTSSAQQRDWIERKQRKEQLQTKYSRNCWCF